MPEFAIGDKIAERYTVIEKLGAGGMGAVYLVEEDSTERKFALKTVITQGATDRNFKRFEMEAKATRLLQHESLVQIYDFGLIDDRQPFFVMEYCQGQNLSQRIKADGALPVDKAIEMFIAICNALTYAHSQGVVHRDLKPSNVMISENSVKVLDFGIAKVLREGDEFNTITQTGEIFGSPLYMSPEQCLGRSVDQRSDVYSLGCMFFEALTGSPPFLGETALATMLKHQSETPQTLKEATLGGDFSRDLETIIARMLAKNPDNRYPDLQKVSDDLKNVQRGEPLASLKKAEPDKPLNKGLVSIGVMAVLIGIATSVFLMLPHEKNTQMHAFLERDDYRKVADIYAASKKNEMAKSYYSTLNPKNAKVRDFHFPEIAIGYFGYDDAFKKFTPACGVHKNVKIPFRLLIKQGASCIPGFRNDEVCWLRYRSILADDNDTNGIKDWHELTALILDDANITDASCENFKQLPKLVTLYISDTGITADGLQKLNLEKMVALNINRVKRAKTLLPRLSKNKVLERLHLIGTELGDEDLKLIGRIRSLLWMDLKNNFFTDAGVSELSGLSKMKDLQIDGMGLTAKSIETFLQLPALNSLLIGRCNWKEKEKLQFLTLLKQKRPSVKVEFRPGKELH
jgi:serine/threonine protein kinase